MATVSVRTFIPERLHEAYVGTLADGGATFDEHGYGVIPSDEGYMVGGLTRAAIIPVDFFTESVFASVVETLARRLVEGQFIGTWVDGGLVYVELAEHVTDLATAMDRAWEREELAIYDLAAGKSIYLDDVDDDV